MAYHICFPSFRGGFDSHRPLQNRKPCNYYGYGVFLCHFNALRDFEYRKYSFLCRTFRVENDCFREQIQHEIQHDTTGLSLWWERPVCMESVPDYNLEIRGGPVRQIPARVQNWLRSSPSTRAMRTQTANVALTSPHSIC